MDHADSEFYVIHVDDSQDDAFLVERCLKSLYSNIKFKHFIDGEGFLNYINEGYVCKDTDPVSDNCIVLLDINMPGLNGIDVLKELQNSENEDSKNIPIVMFSSSFNEKDIEKCKRHGARDYIVKPFSYPEMKETFAKFFDRWKNNDPLINGQ